MAIIKRNGKKGSKYQVRVKGTDGMWITETFDRKADADKHEAELIVQKKSGLVVKNIGNQVDVTEYFKSWNLETSSSGISKAGEKIKLDIS